MQSVCTAIGACGRHLAGMTRSAVPAYACQEADKGLRCADSVEAIASALCRAPSSAQRRPAPLASSSSVTFVPHGHSDMHMGQESLGTSWVVQTSHPEQAARNSASGTVPSHRAWPSTREQWQAQHPVPAPSPSRRPLSPSSIYNAGSAQRLDAMDLLARTARGTDTLHQQCSTSAPRSSPHARHKGGGPAAKQCAAMPGDSGSSSDGQGEAGECTRVIQKVERSNARLARQAAKYGALESYERQLAAELSVLRKSLRPS